MRDTIDDFLQAILMPWQRTADAVHAAPGSCARATRAASAAREMTGSRKRGGQVLSVPRRGVQLMLTASWRRVEMGCNRITCHGVWRKGTRRFSPRPNRSGDTCWTRPFPGDLYAAMRRPEQAL
jgi:hypothetical protein